MRSMRWIVSSGGLKARMFRSVGKTFRQPMWGMNVFGNNVAHIASITTLDTVSGTRKRGRKDEKPR